MLLRAQTLAGIQAGTVSLAFRRWRRPTVRAGGTLKTSIGQLDILAVEPVSLASLTLAQARAAGFERLVDLKAELAEREGRLYRIELRLGGPDPRLELRARVAKGPERTELAAALERLDRASKGGPWTGRVLALIAARPGARAPELAQELGLETAPFKRDVRKLKALGLTESLAVGYRLSPRGRAWLGRRG